jgi:hypothetical protein
MKLPEETSKKFEMAPKEDTALEIGSAESRAQPEDKRQDMVSDLAKIDASAPKPKSKPARKIKIKNLTPKAVVSGGESDKPKKVPEGVEDVSKWNKFFKRGRP